MTSFKTSVACFLLDLRLSKKTDLVFFLSEFPEHIPQHPLLRGGYYSSTGVNITLSHKILLTLKIIDQCSFPRLLAPFPANNPVISQFLDGSFKNLINNIDHILLYPMYRNVIFFSADPEILESTCRICYFSFPPFGRRIRSCDTSGIGFGTKEKSSSTSCQSRCSRPNSRWRQNENNKKMKK